METQETLYKALQTVSLGYTSGTVSIDTLIKCCKKYKDKINFVDDYSYQVILSKSFFDDINGIEKNEEICKSIIPGQTKMFDGIMYIYSATKVGSKTEYGWHVVKKGSKTKQDIGSGSVLDDKQELDKNKFINELFPKDLSTLKIIKSLGGSTGAKLVEDVNGNQYVMKRGNNTSNDHVKSEYTANQIYAILGQRVPDYELYDDNGEAVLLSRYIPMTTVPNFDDYSEMVKGCISDVLVANFDVYQNDNCLKDAAGNIIRVDNGGALEYRARGGKKTNTEWNGDASTTFKNMKKYNPIVFDKISDDDLLTQIDDVQSKKDLVVNYLIESGNDNLATLLKNRIDSLDSVKIILNQNISLNNKPIIPRTLKSHDDMYREFTDDELDDLWKNTKGGSAENKFSHLNNDDCWDLLSRICEERGFNARPNVVDDDTYWDYISKNNHQSMFRGVSKYGGHTAKEYSQMFKFNDDCFYGNCSIYAQGIYAHVNDHKTDHQNKKSDYNLSNAYRSAMSYSNNDSDGVIFMSWEDDAKIVNFNDLKNEILNNPPKIKNNKVLKAINDEIDKLKDEINNEVNTLNNITNKATQDVYRKMHYDKDAWVEMDDDINTTNWGARRPNGEPDYPSWDVFVEDKMVNWVKKQGGTTKINGDFKKGNAWVVFTLPNSREEFTLAQQTYEAENAIKQKNNFTQPYCYPVEVFKEWMVSQHINKVEKEKNYVIKNLGDSIAKLNKSISDKNNDLNAKIEESNKIVVNANDDDIYSAIYNSVNHNLCSSLGVYAALKGYDGLYVPNGNASGHGFNIILNRSKLIVKK